MLEFVDARTSPVVDSLLLLSAVHARWDRRPPRGVPKALFSTQNWYDVWFPNLAPSVETMKLGQEAASPAQWAAFTRKYKAEMAAPDAKHDLELLAVLSHTTNFSVGCYCEDESCCHRSVLKQLLIENGAKVE